jgi:2-amino-4-hydroxy-6-hydroxymethyldihydropteridine diphosphokinase
MQPPQQTQPSDATVVYLGLGSNLGDRGAFIRAAVAEFTTRGMLREARLSPFYETDAVTEDPQPAYLNAVVRGETTLSPETLLAKCLQIEASLGRVRPSGRAKASRTIDIDVLLYGDVVIDTPLLKIPHPAMLRRAFVLVPLANVARPGLVHPVTRQGLTRAVPSVKVRPAS